MHSMAADLIMIIHTILIVLVFLGILLSIKYKRFRPVEALFLLTAVVIWSIYGACPLTTLENYYRNLSGYPIPLMEVGFIPYYFDKWLGLNISTDLITILTYAVAALFLVLTIEWEIPLIKRLKLKYYKASDRPRFK